MKITAHQFARMLDATLTGAVATEAQTREMMALAKQHDFYSVIGPRCYIPMMIEEMIRAFTACFLFLFRL